MKQAQITSENTGAKDLGVIFSSGIGDLTTIQEQVIKMHEKGPKKSLTDVCSNRDRQYGG